MTRILRLPLVVGALFAVVGGIGCGSQGASSGTGGQGGGSPSGGTSGGSGGATTPTTCAVSGTGGAASVYTNPGVCGERDQATADATSFDGYEDRFILGEGGLGASDGTSDVCTVRFDLKRVGDAPAGCTVCTWTHLVEYSNPRVITDVDGVCAKSDLALTSDAIAKINGTRVAIGFGSHYQGAHASVRMKYFECLNTWDVDGNATWTEASKVFAVTFRNGTCNYGP